MSEPTVADTRRLNSKPQDLTDAYGPPSNFLEIDVHNPQTVGVGRNRFTTYEVRMRVSEKIEVGDLGLACPALSYGNVTSNGLTYILAYPMA